MQDSKPVSTPDSKLTKKKAEDEEVDQKKYQAAVGCLLYLSTKTRPDIAFAVGNVARFCSEPTQVHFSAVKRIMRYQKGTQELGLLYRKHSSALPCVRYSDADWGGSLDDRKSTSGYVFQWSGAAVSWRRKQTCVALSTAKAEYIALSAAVQEALWIRQLIQDIAAGGSCPMEILEDNQSAICLQIIQCFMVVPSTLS
jgi:hypothetical protein